MKRTMSDKMSRRTMLATLGAAGTAAVAGSLLDSETVFGKKVTDDVYGNGNGNSWVDSVKNKMGQYRFITDFATIEDAAEWVKQDPTRFVYLLDGQTYNLNTAGTLFFNRFICNKGRAIVNVSEITNLTYLEKTDGTEVLHLENIEFHVAGHRGTLTTSTSYVYANAGTVKTSNIENLKVYGLTNVGDTSSWSDDANLTRMQGFINYKVSEYSRINHVETYGVALFAIVNTANSGATHSEKNITCYNAETGIYHPENVWRSGEASNIKIINNAAQKDYWIKRDAVPPIGRNGKNCVMCEADHNELYVIDNISAKRAIEKSVYNTSANSVTRNTFDDDCFSMATIKSPKQAGTPKSKVDAFNLICKNPTNTNGVQDTYGWLRATLERVSIENDVKNVTKPFIFSDLGELHYKNIRARNTGIPFYFADNHDISAISVTDAELIDCYDANLAAVYYKAAGAKTIGTLKLINVDHYSADLSAVSVSSIPIVGAALDGVVNFKCSQSKWFSKVSPFVKRAATIYLEVTSCDFTLKNSVLISEMWNNLKSTATYAPQANIFDFSIDFVTTNTTSPQPKVKARFKKLNNNGIVLCADYWSQIDIDYSITGANGVSLMTVGDKSFELTASFNDKFLKFYWDATTKTITSVVNLGGQLATVLTSDKINIYVNGSDNRLILNIGNGTWTGGTGNLSVKLERF
ncbi:hypothetical protein PV433_03205 [Paenibacillus sp. GYB004]|uniref:hypothetical protein n=1 Tax=Paenibacillus sp. GYB004 TaxID=2994393 RepID=UPI002F96E0D4